MIEIAHSKLYISLVEHSHYKRIAAGTARSNPPPSQPIRPSKQYTLLQQQRFLPPNVTISPYKRPLRSIPQFKVRDLPVISGKARRSSNAVGRGTLTMDPTPTWRTQVDAETVVQEGRVQNGGGGDGDSTHASSEAREGKGGSGRPRKGSTKKPRQTSRRASTRVDGKRPSGTFFEIFPTYQVFRLVGLLLEIYGSNCAVVDVACGGTATCCCFFSAH